MKRIFFIILFISISCNKNKAKYEQITAYGITIDKDTEPLKIAEVFIKALDEENTDVLKKLVAVNAERKAILKVFKKYYLKPRNIEDENIKEIVISGWSLTYSFFKKGNVYITGDKVGVDSAFVFASGLKVNDERKTIEIRFVREKGYWKILSGLKEF